MNKFYILLATFLISVTTFAQKPLKEMLERIEPGLSAKFRFERIDSPEGNDIFQIEGTDNKIAIKANSINSMAVGVNWYLKYYAHSGTYWCGERAPLPAILPAPEAKITQTTPYKHRYYMNWCVNNYSTVNWDWARWEKEIDWMALNGVTIAFIQIDNESVDLALLEKYTGKKTDPARKAFFDKRIALQQKVMKRMRELGVNPALQGFKGNIPNAILAHRKDVKIGETSNYLEEDKVPFVHPNDPFFKEYGHNFYKLQRKLYGNLDFVTADPIIEVGVPKGIPMDTLGLRVQQLITEAYPSSIWILQGWQADPRTEVVNLTNPKQTLILDLWCECAPQWTHRDLYKKQPWVWNILNNFGGNTGMYGNIELTFTAPREARNTEAGKMLCGLGTTMEGIETNPVAFHALYESAWWKEKPDMEQWLSDYATSRYGKQNVHADKAWAILNRTVYRATGVMQGESENIMCARPSLKVNRVSQWGTSKLYYDPQDLLPAWDELMAAGKELGANDGYGYDIVDLTRQVLSNYALTLYPQIVSAYKNKYKTTLSGLRTQYLDLFDDMNTVLASHNMFLLGHWIDRATSWAANKAEEPAAVIAAKTRISTWGDRNWSERVVLHDYAYREWEGIMKELYKSRWEKYLDNLLQTIDSGQPQTTDWYEFDRQWNENGHTYINHPVGNPYEVCMKVYQKYRKKLE